MQPHSSAERQDWMRVLALASWPNLRTLAAEFLNTKHDVLRAPETGLIMLRGRMGGTGAAFNLGEATVTRCAVRLEANVEGHAYVMGRNGEHAHAAALCDALLQQSAHQEKIFASVVVPLSKVMAVRRETYARKVAATKVDFFTMVRGDV